MRAVSLFTGIGGLELGFKDVVDEVTFFSEIDPYAIAVLKERFPEVPIIPDVRRVTRLGRDVDLLLAGFPCQDVSSVGPKRGMTGAKTSLVTTLLTLLSRDRVPYVVLENVPFILHLRKGEVIRHVLDNLEKLGYDWAYRIVDARSFLPQHRRRLIIVATQTGDAARILLSDNHPAIASSGEFALDEPLGFYWTEGTHATGLSANAVPALKPGSTIGIPSPPAIHFPDGLIGTPDLRDAERLQGFPTGWTRAAERIGRSSHRWRLVGNAVAVPVSRWLAGRIAAPPRVRDFGGTQIHHAASLPNAAFGSRDGRFSVTRSSTLRRPTRLLEDFLRYDVRPLSVKATRGFILRARRGTMRFPCGFIESLEQHSQRVGTK